MYFGMTVSAYEDTFRKFGFNLFPGGAFTYGAGFLEGIDMMEV